MSKYVFRFDDVCGLTDMAVLMEQATVLNERLGDKAEMIAACSPLFRRCNEGERIYPRKWNAMSDYRIFYEMDGTCIPKIDRNVFKVASHGLWHVDHRLLSRDVQEASILTSCYMMNAEMFVPPFNKYNEDTYDICIKNEIDLVRFEDGWRCMEYEDWSEDHGLWYLHGRDWSAEQVERWLK